jgi:hypothetical protein
VLAGNIPLKNKNIAIKWVKNNQKYLLDCWENKTLVSNLPLTNSKLDFKETIQS